MGEERGVRGRRAEGPHSVAAVYLPKHVRLTGLRRASPRLVHGTVIGAQLGVAFAAFHKALEIKPFDADNLIGFTIGAQSEPWQLFRGTFVSYIPGYRPLGYLTIWIEHQLVGWTVWPYFLFNLLAWAAVAAAVYFVLLRLTRNRAIAALFSLLVLVDSRIQPVLFWVTERQLSLAVLFGLGALLVAWRPRPPAKFELAAVAGLVLCAALSKEYGIAFVVPLLVISMQSGRRGLRLAIAAVAGAAAYGLMRIVLAGGATTAYCEDIGYGRSWRAVCYHDLSHLQLAKQYLWNMGAGFLGTIFPSLFEPHGALSPTFPLFFWVCLGLALLAVYALARAPRLGLPLLGLLVGNAVLSLAIYRGRDQAVGMVAFYALAAVGLAELAGERRPMRRAATVAAAAAGVLLAAFVVRSVRDDASQMASRVRLLSTTSACASLAAYPHDIDPAVVAAIRAAGGQGGAPCP